MTGVSRSPWTPRPVVTPAMALPNNPTPSMLGATFQISGATTRTQGMLFKVPAKFAGSSLGAGSGSGFVGRRGPGVVVRGGLLDAGLPQLLELTEGAQRDAAREGVLRQRGRRGRRLGGPGRRAGRLRPLDPSRSAAGGLRAG